MYQSSVILVIGTDCTDPGKNEEFSRWYSEIHIPEVLQVPGMLSATRFENAEGNEGYPKFLAIYQLENEEAVRTFKSHRKKQQAGEIPDFTWGPKFEIKWFKAYRRLTT